MKLSGIVSYKNLIDTLSSRPEEVELLNKISSMMHTAEVGTVQIPGAIDQLRQTQHQISQAVDQFEQQFTQFKQSVQDQIEQHEPEYFQNSLELYNTGYRNDSDENISTRCIVIKPETAEIIQHRLRLYSGWRHPGMVMRPAHAMFVNDLVACDPMYFVDTRDSLLELTESWFTPEYQRRLRRYVVEEHNDQPLFGNFPVGQFGLIYSFHFFEYHAWPALQRYLQECFDLLRPGGVLAFTYNNCDLWRQVGMVEHCSACYTPGRLIKAYAQELGYETVFDFDDDTGTSWMELRRPGNYTSIRGGQTLAAILQRSND